MFLFILPVILIFFIFLIAAIKEISSTADDTNGSSTDHTTYNDIVTDVFVATVKLTPDLHVSGKALKDRMQEYAVTAFGNIDGDRSYSKGENLKTRINKKEQIKVKELEKRVKEELKGFDFQYRKEVLIGMWSLAYADGQATIDQQKLISIVGRAMGLSFTACNRVETMFWQRMKAGQYGDYKEFEKRRDKWFEDEEIRKARKEFEKKQRENQSNYSNQKKTNTTYISPELQKAYAILGLDPSASIDEIKSQKKKLLKRFHPDLFANQGDEMIRKATAKSQSINRAYEMIMESM